MKIKKIFNKMGKTYLYKILDILPDTIMLNLQCFFSLKRLPNLKEPERFTDKIQWYKLNYRTDLMTICADKYCMREYIARKGFSSYLTKLFGVYDSFEEIDFDDLPTSFVIKCNNGSGTNIFVENLESCEIRKLSKIVKSWKMVNTLSIGREWAYKNIRQRIVVEELLIANDTFQFKNGLNDYKILCFNGEPKIAWVDVKRHTDHRRNFYDLNWNKLNVISDKPNSDIIINKPNGFEKMKDIARIIAHDFPFVRVDFYYLNEQIYIGELTFYPWSGCVRFSPDKFDFELGEMFVLPANTNH